MSAHKNFCKTCGHTEALHHHPNVVAGRPCSVCICDRFEKPLAIETPTDSERRREIRLLSEELRRLN